MERKKNNAIRAVTIITLVLLLLRLPAKSFATLLRTFSLFLFNCENYIALK